METAMKRGLRGFEPTYKELKLKILDENTRFSICFEPTYKELKLGSAGSIHLIVMGFEPTYKELKQI